MVNNWDLNDPTTVEFWQNKRLALGMNRLRCTALENARAISAAAHDHRNLRRWRHPWVAMMTAEKFSASGVVWGADAWGLFLESEHLPGPGPGADEVLNGFQSL